MSGCAWDAECQNIPLYRIEVHWTLADFLDCEVCGEHLGLTVKYFRRRRVEGYGPAINVEQLFDAETPPHIT